MTSLSVRYISSTVTVTQDNFDIPEHCKDLTYCTVTPEDYPTGKFNRMSRNVKTLGEPTSDLETRFKREADAERDDCDSDVTFEALYNVRKNPTSAWRTVVQAPHVGYVQRVRLETCKDTNATCFKPFTSPPEYETFCHQNYITMKVMVTKGDNDMEDINVMLPASCSCRYRTVRH